MRSSRPACYTRPLHAHFLAIVPGNYRIVLQRSQLRNLARTYLARMQEIQVVVYCSF